MEDEPVRDANGYVYVGLFDWMLMPHENGEVVGYGIKTVSRHTRFTKLSFLTRRRYPDYRDFWRFIQSRNTDIQLPALPFPDDFEPEQDSPPTMERKFIMFRAYFANFLRIPQVFNDPSFPLFCQTLMPMADIKAEIERQENAAAGNHGAVAANDGNARAAPANNEQPENYGNQVELAERRNNRRNEVDELIFQMDDIE